MKLPPRLLALSPGDLVPGREGDFVACVERALAAGLPGLLLREPALAERAFLALGERLGALRARQPFWFGVHDRAHLVRALGADGLHLSFRSLPLREARGVVGDGFALGLSTHAGDDPSGWSGADYLFHGPLHATPSKLGKLAPVGLEGLQRAQQASAAPVLALGGVRPEDVAPLRARGLHGAAVRAGILQASDPALATRAYLAAHP